MRKIFIVILLLLFVDCKGKEKPQETVTQEPAQTHIPNLSQSPVAPPVSVKPNEINPRIANVNFIANEQVVQTERLPVSDKPPLFVLYGRFDGKNALYAYVLQDRIRFVKSNGFVVAEVVSDLTARFAIRVPGIGNRPDRVLVGWGRDPMSKKDIAKRVEFTLTDLSGKTPNQMVHTILHQAQTDRADPQDAVMAPDGSFVLAWFSDKYTVQTAVITPGSKDAKNLFSAAMISRIAVLKVENNRYTLAVARIYGDQPGSDGGLFIVEDKTWRQLPTVRGVRGLWADIQQDGWDLWAGDGWDKDYGRVAKAYLSLISVRGQQVQRKQIAEIERGFSVFDILPCNLFGLEKPGKLIKTNNQLLWLPNSADTKPTYLASWSATTMPTVSDLDQDGFDEILIATPEPIALKLKK